MESGARQIQRELGTWSGVTVQAQRGGMVFFYPGRRELGHFHGDRIADFPFPVRIREKLVAERKVDLHYLHPQTGWTTYYIHGQEDIPAIIELFRMNYVRPWLRGGKMARRVYECCRNKILDVSVGVLLSALPRV